MKRRSFLAPELLQISSMDCGVAAAACLLAGHGIHTSYERLRELCQTSVDGTSIDSLEDFCRDAGLDVCQHVVPVDCVADVMEGRYPLIAIVRRGTVMPHFVTVWRRVGGYVQIMDPAGGRRWTRVEEFQKELLVHPFELVVESWRDWVRASSLREVLEKRVKGLLGPGEAIDAFAALERADPRDVGALDAALRLVDKASKHGKGKAARAWNDELYRRALSAATGHGPAGSIPSDLWTIALGALRPSRGGIEVVTNGAVLLAPSDAASSSRGSARGSIRDVSAPRSASTEEPLPSTLRDVAKLLDADGRWLTGSLLLGVMVLAVASTLELVLYRAAVDAPHWFTTFGGRAGASLATAALIVTVFALELTVAFGGVRLGRHVELRLRTATLFSLPRVDDQFIRSRPTSDLAYRAHSLVTGRQLPSSVLAAARALGDLLVTLCAIAWLDPRCLAPIAAGSLLLAVVPLVARSRLRELDTRNAVHASRLLTLFLDALRGLRPLRLHGYEEAFRGDQRKELGFWRTTGQSSIVAHATVAAACRLAGIAMISAVFSIFILARGDPKAFVLLAFWAFRIPDTLAALLLFAQSYPLQRVSLLRLLEITRYTESRAPEKPENPTGAADSSADDTLVDARPFSLMSGTQGVSIRFDDVAVVANGTPILRRLELRVRPGEHVAIVGPSGSGKSTLVALVLGFHRAAQGRLLVDGLPLDDAAIRRLRDVTAWIDPAVQLFNKTVRENVEYAANGFEKRTFLETVELSDLLGVLDNLERGLDTPVGPDGNLISGGEGQRVRMARALLRRKARLVVLDEAFRGLDRPTRQRLVGNARRAWADATMLFVTHDISHALGFGRVLVIEDGRIVEDGNPAELGSQRTRFRALLDAEQQVLRELWGAPEWRRLHVAEGAIHHET